MARLELDRQITLTSDQRSALAERLFDLDESRSDIQQRADFVLTAATYGTIAYQYWVSEQIRFAPKHGLICPRCNKGHKDWQPCEAIQPADLKRVAEIISGAKRECERREEADRPEREIQIVPPIIKSTQREA